MERQKWTTGHYLITFDTLGVGLLIMEISVQGKFFVRVSKEFWGAQTVNVMKEWQIWLLLWNMHLYFNHPFPVPCLKYVLWKITKTKFHFASSEAITESALMFNELILKMEKAVFKKIIYHSTIAQYAV